MGAPSPSRRGTIGGGAAGTGSGAPLTGATSNAHAPSGADGCSPSTADEIAGSACRSRTGGSTADALTRSDAVCTGINDTRWASAAAGGGATGSGSGELTSMAGGRAGSAGRIRCSTRLTVTRTPLALRVTTGNGVLSATRDTTGVPVLPRPWMTPDGSPGPTA
jgi:hypothetical protein